MDGIGIDTWGVDFGLLGPDGALVDNPRHYRDSRNNGMMEKTFGVVPRAQIFAETGIQFMQINSLYQLHAMALEKSSALERAATLLFIPDLLNYWLTGEKKAEVTIASTSQFYDPSTKTWAAGILEKLSIPTPSASGDCCSRRGTRPPAGRRGRLHRIGPSHSIRLGRP